MPLLLTYWKPIGLLILALTLLTTGWIKGTAHVQTKWDAEHQALALAASQQAQHQAEATVEVVTKYVDRIKVVRETGATITKEVPIYVTQKADTACTINNGFVRLHDYAATGTLPDSPRDTDATPSTTALSTVATTVAENYGTCHANAEQLRALQGWIVSMASK